MTFARWHRKPAPVLPGEIYHIDMPDHLNPIFVLRTGWLFRPLRKYAVFFVLAYVLYFIAATVILSSLQGSSQNFEDIVYGSVFVIMFFVALFGCSLSASQIDALPKKYIEGDLIHYTPLTEWQIFLGYVYTSAFYSFVFFLCGTLVYFPIAFYMPTSPLVPVGHFFSIFLISQMFSLLAASFFVRVRTLFEFILMGASMYIVLPLFFGILVYDLFLNDTVDLFGYFYEKPFQYWAGVLFYTVPISLLALFLARSPKKPLIQRWFNCVFSYMLLAIVLFLIRFLR